MRISKVFMNIFRMCRYFFFENANDGKKENPILKQI